MAKPKAKGKAKSKSELKREKIQGAAGDQTVVTPPAPPTPPTPPAPPVAPTAPVEPVVPTEPVAPAPAAKTSATKAGPVNLEEINNNIAQLLEVIKQTNKDNEDLKKEFQAERDRNNTLQEQLEFISDKGRLGKWDQKQLAAGSLERNYKIQMYNGKVVVGWTAMKSNLVYKNEHKAYIENQTTNLIYEDGGQEEVQYSYWQANRTLVETTCEGEELLKDGSRLLKLVMKDGKKLTVDAKFVN